MVTLTPEVLVPFFTALDQVPDAFSMHVCTHYFTCSTTMSITAHLSAISASSPSFAATIAHEFVASASAGTLTHSRLALWLAQDRIYAAHAYPRFIGSLIAGIPFSSADAPLSAEEMLNQTILRILIVALQGIADEVLFFDKIAQKYGLDLGEWAERKQTRDYTAEMGRVGGRTTEEGMIFLWAMEKVCP